MKIGVVIPCYKVGRMVLQVLAGIGSEVSRIYIVDDCCPLGSGKLVQRECHDPRIKIIYHDKNIGVGGAVTSGYIAGLQDGCDVLVKIDGDGQMDPSLIALFVQPILLGQADYVKGNRFFSLEFLERMPKIRLLGNAVLSFLTKASSGYWNLMDPTNGYTAIHRIALSCIPVEKLSRGYFFESDMLFRLNTVRAVVREVPLRAVYGEEKSSMSLFRIVMAFPFQHCVRFLKRVFYNYLLRDFNLCSLQLLIGFFLLLFGISFGAYEWYLNYSANTLASTGTVMVATLPVILGFQLVLAAAGFDVANVPSIPLQRAIITRNPS